MRVSITFVQVDISTGIFLRYWIYYTINERKSTVVETNRRYCTVWHLNNLIVFRSVRRAILKGRYRTVKEYIGAKIEIENQKAVEFTTCQCITI